MKGLKLVERGVCWRVTVEGWVLISIILFGLAYFSLTSIHGFLAVHQPVESEVLVLEGWLSDRAVEDLLQEVRINQYQSIIAAGGKRLKGAYLTDFETSADQLRATLIKLGIDSSFIQVVRNPLMKKDRTYSTALEVKQWINQSGGNIESINVVTVGPHGRRSKLLYELAMGKNIAVGVINIPDFDYSPERWWNSSAGVRAVLGESIAYIYSKLFFYPSHE